MFDFRSFSRRYSVFFIFFKLTKRTQKRVRGQIVFQDGNGCFGYVSKFRICPSNKKSPQNASFRGPWSLRRFWYALLKLSWQVSLDEDFLSHRLEWIIWTILSFFYHSDHHFGFFIMATCCCHALGHHHLIIIPFSLLWTWSVYLHRTPHL